MPKIKDLIHNLRDYYEHSPYPIRLFVGNIARRMPVRFRYGPLFVQYRQLLAKSQYWSKEQIRNYQNSKLAYLINHAYNHVPYYRRLLDRINIKPSDIRDIDDLRYLPLLTRDDVRENFDDLVADDIEPFRRKYGTTGGTSGKPLGFYLDKDSSIIEWAFMVTQWERVGFHVDDLRAVLRGRVIDGSKEGKLWEYNPIHNELFLSSFHLNDEKMDHLIKIIRKYKPPFLHAYPSTATVLAKYMQNLDKSLIPNFRAILLGSENIIEQQRDFIEQIYACRSFSWYGHSEKCILAGECEFSRQYHIFPEYGIPEIVDDNGNPITAPGIPGILVGTSLITHSMPFIRYMTDDMAQWASNETCQCGRNYPRIEKVIGRWNQEMLVGRSGSLISMAALNLHSAVYVKIKQFQFYQDTPGKAILRIVRAPNYTDDDEQQIKKEFETKLGHDIQLEISYVSAIEQTIRGKYKFIDQKLNIQSMQI